MWNSLVDRLLQRLCSWGISKTCASVVFYDNMCCIDAHHEKIVEEDQNTSILLQIHNRIELFDVQCIS